MLLLVVVVVVLVLFLVLLMGIDFLLLLERNDHVPIELSLHDDWRLSVDDLASLHETDILIFPEVFTDDESHCEYQ
jgi:hypothetical protein